ncbi:hypothetical protein B7P43_G14263 [Cryptotermes secundus]|uniref:F-box domain-containing protein n=1 Tax=Cryptotermes secundus TaxID=105785 RepID=A0A2J7PH89_9NEOP|nr:hypothetical protein B7P43_G14263 [Cryptotermes secundus]
MPKLKQPMNLKELCLLRIVNTVRCAYEAWTTALREASRAGSEAYLKETLNVTADCGNVHDYLTSMSIEVSKHFAPLIINEFISIISVYYGMSYELKRAPWYDEDAHMNVCSKMLKAVLLNCTTEYDTKNIYFSFVQKIIIQTLDCVPELTTLAFDTRTNMDNSSLLTTNIHHLRNLQHFQYEYHCTDNVVEQLGLHCTELKTINLRESRAVTDASVQHLLKLKKIEYLNLTYTTVSFQAYGSLLSDLPSITNIDIMSRIYPLFNLISKENLYTITEFKGFISDIYTLTQKCPYVTTVEVYSLNYDLTILTTLTRLVNLKIMIGNSDSFNLNAVLSGMGERLNELRLSFVENVNIAHIVILCSSLKLLSLEECTFLPFKENSIIDKDLPHYRSVTELILLDNSPHQMYFRHLRHYVNLQHLECHGVDILTDDFIDETMRQGAFRNILRFCVLESDVGSLTMRTIELLLQHCEHLTEIGYLKTWSLLSQSQCTELRRRIRSMNLDVRIYY